MGIYSVAKKQYPEHGLVQGQIGTIVEIYNDKVCEIEFYDSNGFTLYLDTFSFDIFR